MIVEPGKTYIGKVRATSSERDTLALQLRLSSVLSTINLHPPGLPGSAIACIRRFRDPLPGSLNVQSSGTRPPHAWEQAVQASLKQLVERAVYPARDAVPSNADVVIFADQAEMLACMAKDWCEGNITGRWWWQGLLRGKDIGQVLVPTWLSSPEYIPAALYHLATMEKAVHFVQALRDDEVLTMMQSMIRCFGLYQLQFLYRAVTLEPKRPEPAQIRFGMSSLDSSEVTKKSAQAEPGQETMSQMPTFSSAVNFQHGSLPRSAFGTASPTSPNGSKPESQVAQQPEFRSSPWQPWMTENSGSVLSFERQSLLGIGLMLVQASAVVRSTSFTHAVRQWWSSVQSAPLNETIAAGSGSASEDEPVQQDRKSESTSITVAPSEALVMDERVRNASAEYSFTSEDESRDKDNAATSLESIQFTVSDAAEPTFQSTQLPVSESVEPALEDTQIPNSRYEIVEPTLEDTQIPVAIPGPEEPVIEITGPSVSNEIALTVNRKHPGTVELLEAEIETELGGLFYLINLGLFLNLYGDFTTPLQPGISLSIWDFITLSGERLLGVPVQADPVWGFLARLAGRGEQDQPGKDFDPPTHWRMPAEWLEPFSGEGLWRCDITEGRLRVQHPERFLVFDIPLECGDAEAQLKREMQVFTDIWHVDIQLAHGLIHRDELALEGALSPQVERWLDWFIPYLRVRLQLALGLPSVDDVARILCEHTARINLTSTHLDIVFSLATLPIEVRLSGLDRNPDWVPASGRFIAFHFE